VGELLELRDQLREWADNYPPTFGDKHALVSAEIARLEGGDATRCACTKRPFNRRARTALSRTKPSRTSLLQAFILPAGP